MGSKIISVFGFLAGWQVLATSNAAAHMPVAHLVGYAAALSICGGLASGIRQTRDWFVLLQFCCNTAVMGVSVVMLSKFSIGSSDEASYAALGVAGVLSLGGLSTVDWCTGFLRRLIERKGKTDADAGTK